MISRWSDFGTKGWYFSRTNCNNKSSLDSAKLSKREITAPPPLWVNASKNDSIMVERCYTIRITTWLVSAGAGARLAGRHRRRFEVNRSTSRVVRSHIWNTWCPGAFVTQRVHRQHALVLGLVMTMMMIPWLTNDTFCDNCSSPCSSLKIIRRNVSWQVINNLIRHF